MVVSEEVYTREHEEQWVHPVGPRLHGELEASKVAATCCNVIPDPTYSDVVALLLGP